MADKTIELSYDSCRHITIDFLRQCQSDMEYDNKRIEEDADARDLGKGQLEDFAYNTLMLKKIEAVLKYLGADL